MAQFDDWHGSDRVENSPKGDRVGNRVGETADEKANPAQIILHRLNDQAMQTAIEPRIRAMSIRMTIDWMAERKMEADPMQGKVQHLLEMAVVETMAIRLAHYFLRCVPCH